MSFQVLGSGSYVPEKIVTNDDLTVFMDTSDQWITERTGVKRRHICEEETTTDLAIQAAKRALENAGVAAAELDLILCATVSGEYICPSLACLVQKGIGATCPAMDINAACSAFLYLLATANGFFATGCQKILVVGAEQMSRVVDWKDRTSCMIFGDGAGALVLGKGEGLLSCHLSSQGDDETLVFPTNPYNSPWAKGEHRKAAVKMDGQRTFRYAVNAIVKDLETVFQAADVRADQVDWVVPHQANQRIIAASARRMKDIPAEKFVCNIQEYGNTSSASIPIALDELNRSGQLKKGQLVALVAFGGGLADGAILLRW